MPRQLVYASGDTPIKLERRPTANLVNKFDILLEALHELLVIRVVTMDIIALEFGDRHMRSG